ncbi:hypothetical protein KIL84_005031 [Mauremys mutica]|uniref:Uncharacterized protein n=1 Tax=Mauremys mutica TaxID=74926 RepID=A0A9D4B5R2_9SAUR|nr:hypothetical protein KIL84_005031 [Mauremys mutica]
MGRAMWDYRHRESLGAPVTAPAPTVLGEGQTHTVAGPEASWRQTIRTVPAWGTYKQLITMGCDWSKASQGQARSVLNRISRWSVFFRLSTEPSTLPKGHWTESGSDFNSGFACCRVLDTSTNANPVVRCAGVSHYAWGKRFFRMGFKTKSYGEEEK